MALLLYLVIAAALLAFWSRRMNTVSRAAAIVLVLLPMLLTGKALLTNGIYSTTDLLFRDPPFRDYGADYGRLHMHNGWVVDPFVQMAPWQNAVRHSLSQGEWPLWNPFILSGTPLAAAMQPAPYDPINLISLLVPLDQSITFSATMTFFLAAFFAFAFARELECEERAALAAALVYMLSTAMTFTIGWPPHTRTWALLGLVLLAVRRVVREPGLRNGTLLLVALVLLVFAGHPESLLHVVACGVAYGIFEMARSRQTALRAAVTATIAGVLALLLTAVSLLPFHEAVRQTAEYPMRLWQRDAEYTSDPALTARRAGAAFLPFYGGSASRENVTLQWDSGAGRAGSIALALALAALVIARRRAETWFFAAVVVIGLWAHFEAPPVTQWLHALPLFDLALNDRLSFAAAFGVGVLAALAVNAWDGRRIALVAMVVAIALAVATAMVWRGQVEAGVAPSLIRMMVAAELVPLLLLAAIAFTRPRIAIPILLICVAAQRIVEDGTTYPALPRNTFYPRIPIVEAMKSAEPFRMVAVGTRFLPNTSTLYGLEDVRGYEAMTFRRLRETYALWCTPQPVFFNRVDDLTRPFLSMMNVRYAIASRTLAPPEGWRVVVDDRDSRLLENTRAIPRVFAPRLIRVNKDSEAILKDMLLVRDFHETGWISTDSIPPGEIPNARATIATRRTGSGYSIDVTMEGDGWLFVSDSAWQGWRAFLDGRRVRTYHANHAFLGIFVPAGSHQLRLVYRPASFVTGLSISAVTLGLLLLFWGYRRWH